MNSSQVWQTASGQAPLTDTQVTYLNNAWKNDVQGHDSPCSVKTFVAFNKRFGEVYSLKDLRSLYKHHPQCDNKLRIRPPVVPYRDFTAAEFQRVKEFCPQPGHGFRAQIADIVRAKLDMPKCWSREWMGILLKRAADERAGRSTAGRAGRGNGFREANVARAKARARDAEQSTEETQDDASDAQDDTADVEDDTADVQDDTKDAQDDAEDAQDDTEDAQDNTENAPNAEVNTQDTKTDAQSSTINTQGSTANAQRSMIEAPLERIADEQVSTANALTTTYPDMATELVESLGESIVELPTDMWANENEPGLEESEDRPHMAAGRFDAAEAPDYDPVSQDALAEYEEYVSRDGFGVAPRDGSEDEVLSGDCVARGVHPSFLDDANIDPVLL